MRAVAVAMLLASFLAQAGEGEGERTAQGPLRATGHHGQVGLARAVAADFSMPGTVMLGLHGAFSHATGVNMPGATDTFAAGVLSVEFTPEGLPLFNAPGSPVGLALSLSTRAAADRNSATSPRSIYSVGDIWLGARVGTRAGVVDLSLDGALAIPSRVDSVGPERRSLRPSGRLALTLPFERLVSGSGLRLHGNVGYLHSNSASLLTGYSGSVASYTFGTSSYDAIPLAVGGEWGFRAGSGRLAPFVEYTREQMLGVDAGAATPQRVTPGVRWSPFERLTLQASVDVGLARGRVDGVTPVAPLTGWLGLSFALWPPEHVTNVVSGPAAGRVIGQVRSARTREALARAVVTFPPELGVPPTVTDDHGRFASPPLPPGETRLLVTREGFDEAQTSIPVLANADAEVMVSLVPHPEPLRHSAVMGRAIDVEDKPVAVTYEFTSAKTGEVKRFDARDGKYDLQLLPGRHQVVVSAEGYLTQGYTFDLQPGDRVIRDFLMRPYPPRPAASLTKQRIKISSQLHFEFGRARLLEESYPILDEVVSILLKNPNITRLRIEGHTDDVGNHAFNQRLSDARANTVMDYLLSKGVPMHRLAAIGYGKTRPLVKSTTDHARAKNRRVEFVIAEQ